MTIANKLTQINDIKQDIKTTLTNKGVDVSNTPFTEYASAIDSIVSGGGLPSWIKECEVIEFTPSEDTNEERTFEYNLENVPNAIMILSDFTERENMRDFCGANGVRFWNETNVFSGQTYYTQVNGIFSVGVSNPVDSTNASTTNWHGFTDVTNKSFLFRTYYYGGQYCYWRAGHTYKIIVARVGM